MIASGARYRRLDVDESRGIRGLVACTTGPRRSRRSCAPARRWRWSAPAIRPARRRSIWRARSRRSGCSCAARASTPACRAIWSSASPRTPNIEVLTETEVTALEGSDGILEASAGAIARIGEETTRAIRHLFLFIGADPNTDWLAGSGVALDDKGFVRTGANAGRSAPLETSLPRRVRHRRRALGLGQARRRRRRRRRAGGRGACTPFWREAGDRAAPAPADREDLMADECTHADASAT